MAPMIQARFGPGLFMFDNVLYAFGGQHNSIERIQMDATGPQWQQLAVELPEEIETKYGFSILPNSKVVIPGLSSQCVLIFGGHCTTIYVYDVPQNLFSTFQYEL
jgi:hypothetical protein